MNLEHISQPKLIIDEKICRGNIRKMALKCHQSGTFFRPHFKTHQSAGIGEWFRDEGVDRITVSSVTMAEYFSKAGWNNILIAFPINFREIDGINSLASKVKLHLLVDGSEPVNFLRHNLKHKAGIYLKIDSGLHRAGVAASDIKKIDLILQQINRSSLLSFTGFLTHSGHSYAAGSKQEILNIYSKTVDQMTEIKARFQHIFPDSIISIGDTPSCSLVKDFGKVDEIRPGNFVFYDLMQFTLGSCKFNEIAAVMACPVVAKYPHRNELGIYCGAIHLSKEFLSVPNGNKTFGLVVRITGEGWSEPLKDTYVSSISQEHGIIKTTGSVMVAFNYGDLIGIIPVHSCLTARQQKDYITLEGKILNNMYF